MRTILSLMAVLCFSAVFGQTIPMVSECNSWYHTMRYNGWNGGTEANNHHTYFFNGDSLVGGVEYKKLYLDKRDTIFLEPFWVTHSLTLERLMRQEGDSVFFRIPGGDEELLYTVFNLDLGDTLTYYPHDLYWPDQHITVIGVDSLLLDDEYLTRYALSNSFHFIEGIGISNGMLKDFLLGIEGGIYMDSFVRKGQDFGISLVGDNVYDYNGTLYGCTDTNACNFSSWASVDSGNCIYGACPQAFDLNNDGVVSTADLLQIIIDFGCQGTDCESDFNQDGVVNVADLLLLIQTFGICTC